MSMKIVNDHPFTETELEYLRSCNREAEIENNRQNFPPLVEENPEDSYRDWKVAELKAEIATRNEGRDEANRLPSEGKKDELAAILERDDAETGEEA
jgi:hypothetical protein